MSHTAYHVTANAPARPRVKALAHALNVVSRTRTRAGSTHKTGSLVPRRPTHYAEWDVDVGGASGHETTNGWAWLERSEVAGATHALKKIGNGLGTRLV